MWCLLEGRHLLEVGTYFNVDTQRCGAYYRAALIEAQCLLEEIRQPLQSLHTQINLSTSLV